MGLCNENVLSRVLQEAEESDCPCDELKMCRKKKEKLLRFKEILK